MGSFVGDGERKLKALTAGADSISVGAGSGTDFSGELRKENADDCGAEGTGNDVGSDDVLFKNENALQLAGAARPSDELSFLSDGFPFKSNPPNMILYYFIKEVYYSL